MKLEDIEQEFTLWMEQAEPVLKQQYEEYIEFVNKKVGREDHTFIYTFPSFCFGMYVNTRNQLDIDDQIKDLLK